MWWVKFSARDYLFLRSVVNSGGLSMYVRRSLLLFKVFQKKIQFLFTDQFWISVIIASIWIMFESNYKWSIIFIYDSQFTLYFNAVDFTTTGKLKICTSWLKERVTTCSAEVTVFCSSRASWSINSLILTHIIFQMSKSLSFWHRILHASWKRESLFEVSKLGTWTLLGFLKVLYLALSGVKCLSDKYFDPASWEWVAETLLFSATTLWPLREPRWRKTSN